MKDDFGRWFVCRLVGSWWADPPFPRTGGLATTPFPSWREAYDYAHTHPSNRKETTP